MRSRPRNSRPFLSPALFALLVFGLAAFGWWLWWRFGVTFFASRYVGSDTDSQLARLGQTGDLFGGINALFAAFAFAGVAVAAYYQHLSWKLLLDQAEQTERRARREAFEPLFFRLQDRREKPEMLLAKGMLAMGRDGPIPLDKCARKIRDAVDVLFSNNGQQFHRQYLKEEGSLGQLVDLYKRLYMDNEATLGPYWRSVYHSFRLVDLSGLDEEDKALHASIARASLSSSELLLMILNCQTEWGQGLAPLVEKYALLKHIRRDQQNQSADEFLARCFFSAAALGEVGDESPLEDIMFSLS